MRLHRKGIALDFLITILVAFIIFAPTILIVNKACLYSDQAKQSFRDLAEKITELEKSSSGSRESALLILDETTAVVYFEPNQKQVTVEVDAEFFGGDSLFTRPTDYTLEIQNPNLCQNGKGCLCLFKEPKYTKTNVLPSGLGFDTFVVEEETPLCYETNLDLKITKCGTGKAENVNSYTCKGGFIIERLLAKGMGESLEKSHYQAYRRTYLVLENELNTITVST